MSESQDEFHRDILFNEFTVWHRCKANSNQCKLEKINYFHQKISMLCETRGFC